MIFLSSPYSDPDPAIRQQRYEQACQAAAILTGLGRHVFSPIVHSHPIALLLNHQDAAGWSFWLEADRWFLERCDDLTVLQLPGWTESEGVQDEMGLAVKIGLPITFATMEQLNRLKDQHSWTSGTA